MISPDAFTSKVKPACENFIRSTTKENLDILYKEIRNIEDSTLNRFQSYILIPLIMKMDNLNKQNKEIKTELLACMNHLIKRIIIKDKSAIKTMLIVLLKQVYNFESGQTKSALAEELKTVVMECMSSTFQQTSTDVLEEFYSKENAGFIGKIAVTCVDFINNEKYRQLRIAAIECLMSAFYVNDNADSSDIVIRNAVADIVFVFLPKIVQTLISVANGDEKQGQKLIAISIKALGRILCLIFEDYTRDQTITDIQTKDFIDLVKNMTQAKISDEEILGMTMKTRPLEERYQTLQKLERNSAWFGASSRKLAPILNTMSKLRANESKQIRKEFAIMCCTLLEKCQRNFTENIPVSCLRTIFALSQDDDSEIRNKCKKCLLEIRQNSLNSSFLSEAVISLFETHLLSLPRVINRWKDSEQLSEFLFLKGILENSGDDCLSIVLCIPNNVANFCECLITAFELELNNDLLKEEYAIREVGEIINKSKPLCWRKFKNIRNDKIICLLESICEMLGDTKVAVMIFDYLIGIIAQDAPECNEAILILSIMFGKNSTNSSSVENVIVILDEILKPRRWDLELQAKQMKRLTVEGNSNWYLDRTPGLYESAIEIRTKDIALDEDDEDDFDHNNSVNIGDAQFNVLHTCMLLDAIGHFALALETKFQPFMYKTLHRVLQKAGSSNYVVHEAGMFALKSIQKSFKMETIPDLIREYSNYISYHVNVALKRVDDEKSAFDILSTVLQFSSFNSISYLENIVNTILDESSKIEQSANIESFLKVFHMFLLGVNKWSRELESIEEKPSNSQEPNEDGDKKKDIYNKWLKMLNKEEQVDENLEFDDTNIDLTQTDIASDNQDYTNVIEQDNESVPKAILPRHIQLVIKILKAILKFISSRKQMHKLISIECIIDGLPILKDFEDELLPIVHLIWHPFIQRFKEKDVIVLNRCFTLLEVLAIHAKDFVLQRTLSDVFPFLCDFLTASSKSSYGKTYIVQTQEFKLQSKLLKEYPTLIESMEVHEREFDRISEAVLLYLNKKQPTLLQEYAIEYFRKMCKYNCPAIYIKLLSHLTESDLQSNIQSLLDFIRVG